MRRTTGHNLTYGIVEKLGSAIVTGFYNSNNVFPIEAELCKQLGASRSVLREAVKMLTAKGLLSARPRQGTTIEPEQHWNLLDPDVLRWLLERKFSLGLLAEFTEVRLAVEPMAAHLAARRAAPASLARINRAIERMKAAARGDDDPLESDIAFHVAVLHASGNRFYMQFEEFIGAALRTSIRLTNRFKGVASANVGHHRRVLDAIEARDGEQAHAAMKLILNEVMKLIDAARRARPKSGSARTTAATGES